MKNIGILAVAALLALVLGASVNFGGRTAQAEVTGSVAIGCEFLASSIDGNLDDVTSAGDYGNACDGLTQAEIALIADVIGDEDGELEASDFDDIDLDDNQIQDGGTFPSWINDIYAIAFVDDDAVVTFDRPAGLTVVASNDGLAAGIADADVETCDPADDLDCDPTTPATDDGDGVAVAILTDATADPGDSLAVDIFQADDTGEVSTQTINVMDGPDDVEITVLGRSTIQTSSDVDDCADDAEVSDGVPSDLNATLVQAIVTDNDGNELTRIPVAFDGDSDDLAVIDDDSGEIASDPKATSGITVRVGDLVGAFAVVCGGEDTGTGTATATIDPNGTPGDSDDEDASVDIDVVGEPANVALTASPAAIDCDGTASSTVSATVTDSDGNNVADGTNVNFSVVALGIASPINAKTTDGVASSTITPLSNAVAGVTVLVSSPDTSGEQASIRVDCNAAAAPTPTGPVATPTRGTGVVGPDTGNGGYLGQDSSAGFPAWTLIALALGGVALLAGGMVTRKVTR